MRLVFSTLGLSMATTRHCPSPQIRQMAFTSEIYQLRKLVSSHFAYLGRVNFGLTATLIRAFGAHA